MQVQTSAISATSTQYPHIYLYMTPETKWEPEKAFQLMSRLYALWAEVGIVANYEQIVWYIRAHKDDTDAALNALAALYPDAETEVADDFMLFPHWLYGAHTYLPFIHPLLPSAECKKFDPLVNLVGVHAHLRAGERLRYRVGYSNVPQVIYELGVEAFNDVISSAGNSWRQETGLRQVESKMSSRPLLQANVELSIGVATKARAEELAKLWYSSLNAFEWDKGNGFCRPSRTSYHPVLTLDELMLLWHPPNQHFVHLDRILWAIDTVTAPAEVRSNKEGIVLGDSMYQNELIPVHLLDTDRTTHMSIIGKSGTGKSSLMQNMLAQDIAQGRGVAVIDPHGKLVEEVLRTCIPPERIDDVVVLDIANLEYPPPINPLNLPESELERMAATNLVAAILDKLDTNHQGIRISDTMSNVLSTLANDPQPIVRDVRRLFADLAYRQRLLAKNTNPVVKDFWQDYESQNASTQSQLNYPVIHRMRQFYNNPILYLITCHPQSLNLSQLIQQRKIILISLGIDELLVPHRFQSFLGAVLLSQLEMAHRRAARQQKNGSLEYHLYVDEIQNFTSAASSLAVILSEARKFGLRLVMANQFLGQIKGEILDAVIGNIGVAATFQIGLKDAKVLAPYYTPLYDVESLSALDKFSFAAKMRYQGKDIPPFTINTRKPPDSTTGEALETEQTIRAASIKNYTPMARKEILAWLSKRYSDNNIVPSELENDDDWLVDA